MPYTVTTAVRMIATPEHTMQPYEGKHLTSERFALERGVWVRRVYLKPKPCKLVFEVSGRLEDDGLVEHLLTEMEQGRMPEPGQGE